MVYRYRLKGSGQEWQTKNAPHVEYPNIPRGSYVFEVVAVDRDLVHSDSPTTVALTVHLPYERVRWLSALSVAILLVGWQTARVIRQDRRLTESNEALSDANRELFDILKIEAGRFTVAVPPLRERKDDIPLLAEHFLSTIATEMGREVTGLRREVLERLVDYEFPGNVRELKNLIERALIESRGGEIEPHHLHFLTSSARGRGPADIDLARALPFDLDEAALRAESLVLDLALEKAGGNLTEAVRLLGTTRNRAYRIVNQRRENAS